jgi:hypothetical protein
LILSWNGATWSRSSSPSTGTHDNALFGVACPLVASCQAVGYYVNSAGVKRTLAESYG